MQSQVLEGYRLSPQQKRLWLLGARPPHTGLTCSILIEGPLDPALLGRALDRLVARHEILRTSFERLPGMHLPMQVIADTHRGHAALINLKPMDEAELEQAEARQREATATVSGGLERTLLVRRGVDKHELVLTLSRLCADVWSVENIVADLAALYGAGEGDAAPLDDAIQYTQLSEWQNELLDSSEEEDEEGRRYWEGQRGSLPDPPTLPWESSPPTPGPARSLSLELGREELAPLRALAAVQGATLEEVLLAGWLTLLGRLTPGATPRVEAYCDGRKYDEMRGGVGPYATYLPLACPPEAGFGFRDLLRRVSDSLRAARRRQEYYSEGLAGGGAAGRGVGFAFGRWPAEASSGGLRLSVVEVGGGGDGLKLRLECLERGERLALRLHYEGGRYGEGEAGRLCGYYRVLLAEAAREPGRRLGLLGLVGEAERTLLLGRWAGGSPGESHDRGRGHEAGACVHELFERQAARTPEAAAVVFGDERLSYRELNERANQLARHLRDWGVVPESVVGLLVERGVGMVVGLLGILKAGGAYLPLDPKLPAARLSFMLGDACARVLVTQDEAAGRLAASMGGRPLCVLRLDTEWERLAALPGENLRGEARPDNLAYVIYTSGSTGEPKGVMVTHASAVNLRAALDEAIYSRLPGGLRVGLSAPLSFDASVKQLVQLLSGHTLVVVPEELRPDGAGLLAWARRERVEVLDCTPGQARLLLDAGLDAGDGGGEGSDKAVAAQAGEGAAEAGEGGAGRLRALLVGGEAIDPALWRRLASLPSVRGFNLYGPTECTVDAAVGAVERGGAGVGARRWRGRGSTCWGGAGVAAGWGGVASCTSAGRGWRGGIWGVRG